MAFTPSYNILDKDTHNAIVDALKSGGIGYTEADGTVHKISSDYIEGGGGGSSDFSTAEVAVTTGNEAEYLMSLPFVSDDEDWRGVDVASSFSGQSTTNHTVVLYKGKCFISINGDYTVSVSGNATFDEDEGVVIVTGDCTITVG